MIEATISKNIVDALTFVPLIASIYQVYLRRPKVVKNQIEAERALLELKDVPLIELGTGTYDVTPEGAEQNYTIHVFDNGAGDNMGSVQVSHPSGRGMVEVEANERVSVTRHNVAGESILYNPKGDIQIIGEETPDHKVKIFGALIYRPKGQPVF